MNRRGFFGWLAGITGACIGSKLKAEIPTVTSPHPHQTQLEKDLAIDKDLRELGCVLSQKDMEERYGRTPSGVFRKYNQ